MEKREKVRQAKRLEQQKRTAEKRALKETILVKAKQEQALAIQEEQRIKVRSVTTILCNFGTKYYFYLLTY